jgi:hypothetical protein
MHHTLLLAVSNSSIAREKIDISFSRVVFPNVFTLRSQSVRFSATSRFHVSREEGDVVYRERERTPIATRRSLHTLVVERVDRAVRLHDNRGLVKLMERRGRRQHPLERLEEFRHDNIIVIVLGRSRSAEGARRRAKRDGRASCRDTIAKRGQISGPTASLGVREIAMESASTGGRHARPSICSLSSGRTHRS